MRNLWFVVLVMGIWTTSTLIAKSDMTLEEEIERLNLRNPASVAGQVAGPGQVSGIDSLEIDCQKAPTEPVVLRARHLRIFGRACPSVPEVLIQRSQIEATTFSLANKQFTTDYFRIENGENEISLKWKGQKSPLVVKVIHQ